MKIQTILLLHVCLISSSLFAAEDASRPNILLIITDQQNSTALSAAGNPHVKTPALDRLAARGVRFTKSYCTYPLCSPSRASQFTSRMPHEVRINSNRKPDLSSDVLVKPSFVTLATLLRAHPLAALCAAAAAPPTATGMPNTRVNRRANPS